MASRVNWELERQRRRDRKRDLELPVVRPKRKKVAVHPNSMAARKWGVTEI
jgi:hypothetical protein